MIRAEAKKGVTRQQVEEALVLVGECKILTCATGGPLPDVYYIGHEENRRHWLGAIKDTGLFTSTSYAEED